MIPEVNIEVSNVQELLGAFIGIERIADNFQPIFETVGVEALSDIQRRFDVAGPGWQPHALSTRAKKIGPSRILWDTGALRGSFAKNASGNVFRVSDKAIEIGSTIFYGIFHQEGAGHLPVRLIIDVTPEQETKYAATAMREFATKIRALGFEVS